MEPERHKRRKCGPRVKTGCITCRIRRVKCDEAKPDCQRCVSTGRKCDGYVTQQKPINQRQQTQSNEKSLEIALRPQVSIATPHNQHDDPKSRQLFHFYCVQSAFDLSVYLNSKFWHDMILQYSHHHPVVRQAVVAFGSSHLFALSMNQSKDLSTLSNSALEQAKQYDLAIRFLRKYMKTERNPDPHVILICCALCFSCENSLGNRQAAWQHLENGLHILNSLESHKTRRAIKSGSEVSTELELVASKNGSILKAKTDKVEIDEELVYVFSRLDVQATLCKQTRKPMLNLEELSHQSIGDRLNPKTIFATITDAQRTLDYLHSRLARFLSIVAAPQPQDMPISSPEPDWIETERLELDKLCVSWETCMFTFVTGQNSTVKQNLKAKHAPKPSGCPELQLALQIQLLTLHHRCWWMLFRSYHNPSIFTASPNVRASEILDICDFLCFALPVRPSAVYSLNEFDTAWKMVSEIGVTAPLFVLATKCTDQSIRSRAIGQLQALRDLGNGMYHETFLDQVIKTVLAQSSDEIAPEIMRRDSSNDQLESLLQWQQTAFTPGSESTDGSRNSGMLLSDDDEEGYGQNTGGLLGWSRASFSA